MMPGETKTLFAVLNHILDLLEQILEQLPQRG